ncbi:MAG: hypothetical protein AB1656_05150 [Candidatus Omnitrophota bacterium]
MPGYNYFSEGVLAKTDWNNLALAVQLNLNYLEGFAHIYPLTEIVGNLEVVPPPVWSYRRIHNGVLQQETLMQRIDRVRAAIGFAPFEWPSGFDLESSARMLSAADLQTLARAVGCPYEASQTQYPSMAMCEPAYAATNETRTGYESTVAIVWRTSGSGIDYYTISRGASMRSSIHRTSLNADANRALVKYIDYEPFPGMPLKKWRGSSPIEKIQSFAHAIVECLAWPVTAHTVAKWYDCGVAEAFFAAGLPDPSKASGALTCLGETMDIGKDIKLFNGTLYFNDLNHSEGVICFLPAKYPKSQEYSDPNDWQFFTEPDSPGIIGAQFVPFNFTQDAHITATENQPQIAILSSPIVKQAKHWEIIVDFWSHRFLVDTTEKIPTNYKVSAKMEGNAAIPTLFRAQIADDVGNIATAGTFAEGAGAVMDYVGETSFNVGCSIDPSWSAFPDIADVDINDIESYRQFISQHTTEQRNNGSVMKRKVCYAEVDFTIPVVWLASQR